MQKLKDIAKDLWENNRELILYLFFGFLSFLISIFTYAIFNVGMGIHELIANIYSWVLSVTFAYITNKKWVFCTHDLGVSETAMEVLKFFGGRVLTLVLEEGIIFVFITVLHLNSMLFKIVAQVVVIGLNYIISKRFVFQDKDE